MAQSASCTPVGVAPAPAGWVRFSCLLQDGKAGRLSAVPHLAHVGWGKWDMGECRATEPPILGERGSGMTAMINSFGAPSLRRIRCGNSSWAGMDGMWEGCLAYCISVPSLCLFADISFHSCFNINSPPPPSLLPSPSPYYLPLGTFLLGIQPPIPNRRIRQSLIA